MKTIAAIGLLLALASPAVAGVIYDESVDGDLSTDPNAPTLLALALGGNTVIGTVINSGVAEGDRDFVTFQIPPGRLLTGLNLLAYSPTNISFMALNSGSTSFIPSVSTQGEFLSGIHVSGADLGSNLMLAFVNNSVVENSLPEPQLGPGQYCLVIQQTTNLLTSYSLEFVVVDGPVPTLGTTWSTIKSLYR